MMQKFRHTLLDSFERNKHRLLLMLPIFLAAAFGLLDPATAAMGAFIVGDVEPASIKELERAVKEALGKLSDGVKRAQDAADNALEEVRKEGTIHGETNKKLTELSENNLAMQKSLKSVQDTLLELEQKHARKPDPTGHATAKTAGQLFVESEEFKAMIARKDVKSAPVDISRKTILTGTINNDQPLVAPQRLPGIVTPPERRLTIRNLLPQIPTTSNLIEFARELVYTNNANYQGATASPTGDVDGEIKPESNITSELANAAVVTIAHWIGASRQILSDAPQLAGYIDARLGYGLKLKEETELLSGNGEAGKINGLLTQATAFTGGATNQTALDTLLKAFLQVSLAEYEASGVVLHPTDWTNIMLLKDTTGRYLFADPQAAGTPRVWGKDVVPTQSMTQGQFLTGAFDIAAAIYDNEMMNIRISDSHDTYFVKNLIAILCEERMALVVYRPTAFVDGALSYAG